MYGPISESAALGIDFADLEAPQTDTERLDGIKRRSDLGLWSVVEVLERTRDLKAHVKSHPTAGGMVRGAHNCGACDRKVVDAIEDIGRL